MIFPDGSGRGAWGAALDAMVQRKQDHWKGMFKGHNN